MGCAVWAGRATFILHFSDTPGERMWEALYRTRGRAACVKMAGTGTRRTRGGASVSRQDDVQRQVKKFERNTMNKLDDIENPAEKATKG